MSTNNFSINWSSNCVFRVTETYGICECYSDVEDGDSGVVNDNGPVDMSNEATLGIISFSDRSSNFLSSKRRVKTS